MDNHKNTHNDGVLDVEFDDNRLLSLLFGENDTYLKRIELSLGVHIRARGNRLHISGSPAESAAASRVLRRLYGVLKKGDTLTQNDVDRALQLIDEHGASDRNNPKTIDVTIQSHRKVIAPRTPGQIAYLDSIQNNDLVFGIGPAGTGKTYLAVAAAVSRLLSGEISRIILSRPAVEAGERLGFLPGDLKDKVDPYLRPLYDALHDMLPADQIGKRLANGDIEVAPLAFMRGRTLRRACVILDEAQNTTIAQMKMFLTRLGDGSKMVVTGDLTQIDLPTGTPSGLRNAVTVLHGVPGVGFTHFTDADVVRHPLVGRIVQAYDRHNTSV